MQHQYENYDPSFPDQPVVDLYLPIWARLPSFRSKPAFIWAENLNTFSHLTYEEINSSVELISSNLLVTLQRGDTVLLLCPPGLDLVEVIFGCQRAGLLSVPIIPPHPSFAKENYHHLVRVISQTKPKAAIAHPDYISSVRHYVSSSKSHNKKLAPMLQNLLWIPTNHIKLKPSTSKDPDSLQQIPRSAPSSSITTIHPVDLPTRPPLGQRGTNKDPNSLQQIPRPAPSRSISTIHPVDLPTQSPHGQHATTNSTAREDPNTNLKNLATWKYGGCKAEEVYLVQYTSGATGVAKPVLVTAGSAAHNVRTARKAYDLHPNSRIVSWLPQYHDCGLMFLLLTIVSGATCVLTSPSAFIKNPRLWLELMTKFKATCTPVPSFALPLVVKRGGISNGTFPINLSTLKNLIIINEPIYRDSVEHFVHTFSPFGLNSCCISPSYGLAENCTFVSTSWRGDQDSDDFPTHKKLLPVARLSSREDEDVEIVVVNEETSEAVEDGVEGEIWVSSPSNASGYLGHPSLTREVFHGRLRNRVSRCFLRTGDRGIVKGKQRYLFVTGRCQDVIELQKGEKMHPHYIETAAYNSCRNLLRGGCIAAFKVSSTIVVVAEMQRIETEVVLRGICNGIKEGVMKKEKVEVGRVVLVKSECVPKTTSGKLQRWLAKEKLLEGKMVILMEMPFREDVGVWRTREIRGDNEEMNSSVLCAETRSSLMPHL